MLHHLLLAAEGAYRHAGTDDLAKGGEIRVDVVVTLGTAQGDAEASHHLVQDQQGTELVTDGAQPFQEAGDRRDAVHVACDRLDDDTGDLAAVLGEGFTHRIQIVEDAGQGVFGEIGRNARAVRLTQGQGAGTGLDQQGVGVAVVAALEFDDLVAAGVATGQTDGAHGGFGAGVDHPHLLHGGDDLADFLGHQHFDLGRRTVAQPLLNGLDDGGLDGRVVVTQQHGAPGADVIHVGLTIHIIEIGAIGVIDEAGRAADPIEGADR